MNDSDENISFDDAEPSSSIIPMPPQRQLQRRGRPEQVTREMPHSIGAEESFIGCCLIDGAETLASFELDSAAFYSPAARLVYERLREMLAKGKPIETLTLGQELTSHGELDEVGGYAYLVQISGNLPTTAQAGYFAEKIEKLYQIREVIKRATGIVEDCYKYQSGGLDEILERPISFFQTVSDGQKPSDVVVEPITNFDYPESDDPNILLGNDDYLGRGGGMLVISHAGAGKSSFIVDACMTWALGRPFFGIKCNGKLKCLIVQSEDSARYIGKISRSFIEANQLSKEDVATLTANVKMAKVRGIAGAAFFARLRVLIAQHNPDLVIINPLYLYAEGDISRSEFAQPFLVGLDLLNKEEKFAYIIVHHTGKPAQKDNKGKRASVEDWESTYMGFGSSYLANWPRCSMFIEPVPGEGKRFVIKLGKASGNAGVTKIIDHEGVQHLAPSTKIPVRYSRTDKVINGKTRRLVHWETDDTPEDSNESEDVKPGRKPKYDFITFAATLRSAYTGYEKRQSFSVFHRKAGDSFPIPRQSFIGVLERAIENGEVIKSDDGNYFMPST